MEINVELVGIDRLIARLGKASETLDPKTIEGLSEVADKIVSDAKTMVPIETGSLQKSICKQHHVSEGNIHNIGVSSGGYVTNPKTGRIVNYAAHVEYGTSKMAPKPYLRPALEANRQSLTEVLREKVEESLK